MSKETTAFITILLFIFVLSAFIWPIALGMHLELEGRKKRGEPPAYDERQKLARLRAGSHAMYVLLFFLVLWAIINQLGWFDWTKSVLDLVLCAMLLTWCAWASDCILHNGFSSWKDKRKDADVMVITFSLPMAEVVRSLCDSDITASWVPFIFVCVDMVIFGAVLLYKWRREKYAEREEEAL